MRKHVLILGGTEDALHIAEALYGAGFAVTTSLAGVTAHPKLPVGTLRVGGFGGAAGLRDFIGREGFAHVIDATHPFAAQMAGHVFEATDGNVLRFARPAWTPQDGDLWVSVASLEDAANRLPAGARVFITTGRKNLAPFFRRNDISAVVRTIERPSETLPPHVRLVLDRPPFDVQREIQLFQVEKFTHLLTKNAGGALTYAKIAAARHLGLPVLMIERPIKPPCQSFHSIDALVLHLAS